MLPDQREQVIDPARAYQMVNLLQGVVERGTGKRARGDRQAGRRQDRHHERQPRRLVRRLHARSGGRRLHRLRPAQSPRRRGAGRDRAALPVFVRVHGGGAEGPAGDAVPRAARRPPGPGRRRDRPAGRTGSRTVILEAFLPGTEPTAVEPAARTAASIDGEPAPARRGLPRRRQRPRRRPAGCTDAGTAAAAAAVAAPAPGCVLRSGRRGRATYAPSSLN